MADKVSKKEHVDILRARARKLFAQVVVNNENRPLPLYNIKFLVALSAEIDRLNSQSTLVKLIDQLETL
jgi:hypothetical protein